MKHIFLLTLVLSFFLSFTPVWAQSTPSGDIKSDDVKHLIETLESDTARKDLLTNLHILLEQQSSEKQAEKTLSESLPALTEQLGFRGKIVKLVREYERFLDKNAISSSMVHQALGSFVIFLVMTGLLLGVRKAVRRLIVAVDHLSTQLGVKLTRVTFYTHTLQNIARILILGVAVYTLGKVWELKFIEDMFESAAMRSFLSTSVTVLFVAVIAAFVWESVGIYLSYILKQADDKNQTRVKTLLPILRNIVLSVFGLLFGLMLLAELGINVAPLIAGAGVIGVAIGFGAQSMVKDFLTGFTIVLEDIIRVGDVASMAGCTGSVEKITLRKVQLRDFAGTVYTIPFSQITTIQNLTKDFSFYVMDISVAYNQNTDTVIDVLRGVDENLRVDPAFSEQILAPLEIVGVDRFADSAVVIKARIKTRPIKQWEVGREFNRRMKIAFDQNGIEIPFPQRVVTVRSEAGLAGA